jgi:hypothetical protein
MASQPPKTGPNFRQTDYLTNSEVPVLSGLFFRIAANGPTTPETRLKFAAN